MPPTRRGRLTPEGRGSAWRSGFLLLALLPPVTSAAEEACMMPEAVTAPPAVAREREAPDTPANVRADRVTYDGTSGRYRFSGDVELERVDQRLRADRVDYSEPDGLVEAEGDIRYGETGLSLTAREGFLYLDESRGRFEDTDFALDPGTAHGDADSATVLDRSRVRLDDVRYTLCPAGEEDWWLRWSQLVLDRAEGIGTARNARLEFLGVPLFYTPYISFPIGNERKTGFLAPQVGYSSETGFDLETPYYLNLAPDYDLTLYPRLLAKRGLLLGAEPRWLTPYFFTRGYFEYIADDQRAGEEEPPVDSARWLASGELTDTLGGPLSYRAAFSRVSDDEYFDDFESGLIDTATTHLPSYAEVAYREYRWSLVAQARTWQTVDRDIRLLRPQNLPYRRLPRLAYSYSSDPVGNGWVSSLDAELVNFDHPRPDITSTGLRSDIMPQLSYRHVELGYFVTPSIALRHTRYDIDRPAAMAAAEDTPTRTLPVFSIDSGLFLERELALFDRALVQTLEPRVMYLYVPERDQSELPLFDTSDGDLGFARLFSANRFTGADRVGDANQFALGITSRFMDRQSGREYLRAGLGQIYYLDAPDVTLGAMPTANEAALEDRSTSDLLGQLRLDLGTVVANFDAEWDPYDKRTERAGAMLTLTPEATKRINIGYRTRRDTTGTPLEQTELSFVWPLRQGLFAVGGWHYSLRDDVTLERFAGVAYQECCWSARLVAREWIDDATVDVEEYNRALLLQLEFTGLGAVGQPVAEFIGNVTGYNINGL